MNEEPVSAPSRASNTPAQYAALAIMVAGFTAFLYGLGRGMAIDPRVDMHGRMVAYAIGVGGLTAASVCQYALVRHRAMSVVYAGFAALCLGTFIYQLTQVF